MPDRHVVHLFWAGRRETVEDAGARLHRLFTDLGKAHRGLRQWWSRPDRLADNPASCRDGLVAGAVEWELGEETRTAYQTRFWVARESASPAEVTLTCGLEPLPMRSLFAPNHLTLAIRHDAPDEMASREMVQAAMTSAITHFEADFGHAGSDRLPTPAMALYSPGVPPVGWMTYLSSAYPPVPPKLPSPAVSYAVGKGSLIVAHPKPFREHASSHRDAVANVARALDEAGVRLPWAQVRGLAG